MYQNPCGTDFLNKYLRTCSMNTKYRGCFAKKVSISLFFTPLVQTIGLGEIGKIGKQACLGPLHKMDMVALAQLALREHFSQITNLEVASTDDILEQFQILLINIYIK